MSTPHIPADSAKKTTLGPFRRALLRGLGVLMPPLLTIVIFLWVGTTVNKYILSPLEQGARWCFKAVVTEVRDPSEFPTGAAMGELVLDHSESKKVLRRPMAKIEGDQYVQTESGKFIPSAVYRDACEELIARGDSLEALPRSAKGVYELYTDAWLPRRYLAPVFLIIFIFILYLFGRFLAAGVGRLFWSQFESLIHRLPVVRNVYSSVKQVTDFLFTDPEMEFSRVVAVEYPRKGIWTVAFVTGESMLDIESAANEQVMSILIPTSPMPFTGFTVTVKKSETIDLNLSVDQAFQFIISCGVVVPPQQLTNASQSALRNGASEQAAAPRLNVPSPQQATPQSSDPQT